jgi:FKBP-type peptidyl-prolyl cis-trans isomerase FkpA
VAAAAPTNDTERTLYALGALEGQRMREFALTPREVSFVQQGLRDQLTGGRVLVNAREYIPRIQDIAETRARAASAETRRRGTEFADRAAREPGAERLSSGLVYRDVSAGTGASPTASDTVTVHYRGTLIDGTEFDSSRTHNEPATFALNGVIPCWTEGVQRMKVGGRARLVCPPEIAYGDRAQRLIPAGSTLDFEVELISIAPRPEPVAAGDGGTAAVDPMTSPAAAAAAAH